MKSLVFFAAVLLFSWGAHQFLPWWAVCITALLVSAVMGMRPARSFALGFIAAAVLWGGMAGWLHQSGDGLLAGRIGQLFGGLPAGALIGVTALFGGLLGGMGALTGSLGRRLTR